MSASDTNLVVIHAHPTLRVDPAPLERLVQHVLRGEGCALRYLGVVLADHDRVLTLNRTYLAQDYLTDVLSFDLSDEPETNTVEGEVYVDLDTAAERHAEFDTSFEAEVWRYVAHGLLHLIGYDDATPAQKAAMQMLEDRYLSAIG